MPKRLVKRLSRERPYYLIPIMMGMAGVLFSSQLEDPVLRAIVVLLCLAIPLFIGGNLLARIYSDGLQRWLLIAGMATLTVGAVVTVSGLSESLVNSEFVPPQVGELSRWIGMGSLLLGLLVVLYTLMRSEELIDELGDRFRHVADHMGEGFLLIDAQGKVVLVNRALKEMTGIEGSDVVGHRLQALAHEHNVEPVADHSERRRRGLASEYDVVWMHEGDETRFHVTESPLFDRRKRRVGTLLTLHDITEEYRLRVRLEGYTHGLQQLVESRTEKLRQSERRYRELLMTMNEGFVTVNRDLRVRFTNDRIRDILQISPELFEDRMLTDFIHPKDRARLRNAIQNADRGSVKEPGQEYLFIREDGGATPVKVSIALLEEAPESGRGQYSLVITDVQELKAMQRELERRARELELANEELRELDRAKDVFLSNVSHELRTPLGTIDGYIDMMESESLGPVAPPQKSALEIMSRNVTRLTSMINEMIESSRMQIRGIRLVRELFQPAALLQDTVASAHPQALNKGVSISAHASDELTSQWGDRDKLGQVLGILLSNAVKFTPEGGSITLTATQEKKNLVFTVRDTGIGIAPEYHERIFRKFFQVDSSMTRKYQGTGIGLSIAQAIVDTHGGRIELESAPGKGSTFRVVLPDAAFEAPPINDRRLEGQRVLLLDPCVESLEALSAGLEGAGATVIPVTSAYECLRQAAEGAPDIVIVDEALTDLAIVELLQRLEAAAAPEAPSRLTLWDRRSEHEGEEESTVEKLSRVLTKPFTAERLVAAVAEELDARAMQSARALGDAG